jgi:hypothetical protein
MEPLEEGDTGGRTIGALSAHLNRRFPTRSLLSFFGSQAAERFGYQAIPMGGSQARAENQSHRDGGLWRPQNTRR